MIDYLHLRLGWPKGLLWPLWPFFWTFSMLYGGVVKVKNWRWDLFPPQPVGNSRVICIGNLSAGGTGKTPMGLALAQWLKARGRGVEIILRGYGAQDGFSDEAQLYRNLLGEEKVHQEKDRILAMKENVSKEADVVLLDDAFQHRRVHRDLDIVLWDLSATCRENHVIPWGLLRESMAGLKRADVIVMTRCDKVEEHVKLKTLEHFRRSGWGKEHFFATSKPIGLWAWPSGSFIESGDVPCFLVSGIGKPEAFLSTSRDFGLKVVGYRWFADHHPFSEEDIRAVWDEAEKKGAKHIVVTSKDVVKWKGDRPVWVLEIEMKLEERFWPWFEGVLERGRG